MSSGELSRHIQCAHDIYWQSSKADKEQTEARKQGNRVVTQPEHLENSAQTMSGCVVVEGLRTSRRSQEKAADMDLPAVQEYISRLPEALVPEFALLLAQRMKQQIRNSDKFSNEATARAQAEASPSRRTQTEEHAARLLGRMGRSDSITALRYIVTTHLSYPGTSIKHSVGEPEIIPYMPPGLYKEDVGGRMELESSFRSFGMEPTEALKDGNSTHTESLERQGRLRKMMSKVFRR